MRSALKSVTAFSRGCHERTVVVQLFPTFLRRSIQISTTASTGVDALESDPPSLGAATPDATFDILASPDPLLSVSLSPSQNLYTRRGTLVGVSGKAENAISTLSMLGPLSRSVLRIPFIYQRVASTSPLTALISTKSPSTSLAVVHLDGSLDWILAGKTLLAWTGQTLSIRPKLNRPMSLAHWGNSEVTGRGLLALTGRGSICQLVLKTGESYVAHPSNVVAYTVNAMPPSPYRLKSTTLQFQVPRLDITSLLPETKFFRVMRESPTWHNIRNAVFRLRTWLRKTFWGDRLFLQFHGPTTILLQTRAARLNDVLSNRDVDEMADIAPGHSLKTLWPKALSAEDSGPRKAEMSPSVQRTTRMSTATVGADGRVSFEAAKELNRPSG